jgi:RimJ/RimL family protein N-acetyltransferase
MGLISPKPVVSKTRGPYLLRTAAESDAAALLNHGRDILSEGMFGVTRPEEFCLALDEERDWICAHREAPGDLALVAEAAGALAGLLFFESGPRLRQAHRGALHMSVERAWRGQGVGEAMLNALMDWAKENPVIEKVGLAVLSTNTRAIGLYKKAGFIEEGRRPREIKMGPNEYVDEVLMFRFVK